jgi:hypothetical protein
LYIRKPEITRHTRPAEIHFQPAHLEQRRGRLLLDSPAQRRLDAREQLRHAEGLDHVVVGAEVEGGEPMSFKKKN